MCVCVCARVIYIFIYDLPWWRLEGQAVALRRRIQRETQLG